MTAADTEGRGRAGGATTAGAAADAAADAAAGVEALGRVQRLLARDPFSRWLGLALLDAGVGRATVRMTVRPEMANGFGTAHGGIVFALADSALAFCTNAAGRLAVAADCTVSYPVAVRPGDVLTAAAVEQSSTRRLGFCDVTVRNQDHVTVAHFRGTVYRTDRPLEGAAPDPTP